MTGKTEKTLDTDVSPIQESMQNICYRTASLQISFRSSKRTKIMEKQLNHLSTL